jgi:hypothetical protein
MSLGRSSSFSKFSATASFLHLKQHLDNTYFVLHSKCMYGHMLMKLSQVSTLDVAWTILVASQIFSYRQLVWQLISTFFISLTTADARKKPTPRHWSQTLTRLVGFQLTWDLCKRHSILFTTWKQFTITIKKCWHYVECYIFDQIISFLFENIG